MHAPEKLGSTFFHCYIEQGSKNHFVKIVNEEIADKAEVMKHKSN